MKQIRMWNVKELENGFLLTYPVWNENLKMYRDQSRYFKKVTSHHVRDDVSLSAFLINNLEGLNISE